jgi:N6-adenosine-specific RNA methylase IME4
VSLYDVILADPPWYFRNYSADDPHEVHDRGRGQQRHYPTMTEDEICALQVPASDNAVLFLWSCWPILPQSLRVIEAWGFEYKTLAWVWVKSNPSGFGFFTGMGYYTRSNSEPCLLATRGSLRKPANRSIQSLIYSPVMQHSRKPDDQYRKIESLYPGMKYLEMFARRTRPGWDVFGNEVENSIRLQPHP